MDTPDTWSKSWYFKKMLSVGDILVNHAQDVGVKEELMPLRHALVRRLDGIQRNYSEFVKNVKYNRAAILTNQVRRCDYTILPRLTKSEFNYSSSRSTSPEPYRHVFLVNPFPDASPTQTRPSSSKNSEYGFY